MDSQRIRNWLLGSLTATTLSVSPIAFGQTPMPDVPVVAGPAISVVTSDDQTAGVTIIPGDASCPAAAPAVNIFKNVPPVRQLPRSGNFPIPPTGPGYYSLMDALTGTCLKAPPKYPYPRFGLMQPSFFDADFRYLDDPKNTEHDYADGLKRIRVGENLLFSTGGSTWNRYMNEYNSRLTGNNNVYNLSRVRAYADLWYKDDFRVYGEFIGAYSVWQDLPALAIDETGPDILNLFVDVRAFDLNGKPVYVRVGRQELLLGSQRLVSPLEWANTRRTFQGVRAFRQGEKFDVDVFWAQPVIPNANKLDSGDNNQNFAGAWTTYRPRKGVTVDAYYLMLDNVNNVTQQSLKRSPITTHTFGSRFAGDKDNMLWDFEGALQLGRHQKQDIVAGMVTAGLGYHLKDVPTTPTLWFYYDYATGDRNPGVGTYNTFSQLFPFGHYYLGWADVIGRQNIHDFNVQLYSYPTKWLTMYAQYHRFYLDSTKDALYNIAGNAIRRDPTGNAGDDVGQELDVVLNFHLTKHADLMTGYSYLWGGDFLKRTAGATGGVNTSTLFVQMGYRW